MLSGVLLGIVEMLIPNGKTEKVVSFSVSLVLLVMLLSPLKNIIGVAMDENFDVERIIESSGLRMSETREKVNRAIEEGGQLFSGMISEYSESSVVRATVQALLEIGVKVESEEVSVEMDIQQDLMTIFIETSGFEESELSLIGENTADLEVQLGSTVAQVLNIDRNLIRLHFD